MLQTQVDYWKLVEQKRHNLVDEAIARQNATSNRMTSESNVTNANTNIRNAETNVENARINALNASANLQNAESNRQNAESNRRQAGAAERQAAVAETNAQTNIRNAEINAQNAHTNVENAASNRMQARANQQMTDWNTLPGSLFSMGVAERHRHGGALKTMAEIEAAEAKAQESGARADYYLISAKDVEVQMEPKKLKTQTESAKNIADIVKSGFQIAGELPLTISNWKLLLN